MNEATFAAVKDCTACLESDVQRMAVPDGCGFA